MYLFRNTSLAEESKGDVDEEGGEGGEGGTDEDNTDNLGGATQALRQNQLATQLAELNKVNRYDKLLIIVSLTNKVRHLGRVKLIKFSTF